MRLGEVRSSLRAEREGMSRAERQGAMSGGPGDRERAVASGDAWTDGVPVSDRTADGGNTLADWNVGVLRRSTELKVCKGRFGTDGMVLTVVVDWLRRSWAGQRKRGPLFCHSSLPAPFADG